MCEADGRMGKFAGGWTVLSSSPPLFREQFTSAHDAEMGRICAQGFRRQLHLEHRPPVWRLALAAGDGSYTGASRKNFIATAFYAHSAQLLAQAMDALDMDGAAQFEVSTPVDAGIQLHGISCCVAPGMYQFAAEQFVSGAFTDI